MEPSHPSRFEMHETSYSPSFALISFGMPFCIFIFKSAAISGLN